MAVMEFPDYQKLYQEQCKQIESLTAACGVLRESLRDQFAMAILPALMQRHREHGYSDTGAIYEAYSLADTAMEARKEAP